MHLTIADGKTIDATEGHPFNTPEGWRDALLLKKGGELILKGENGEAKSIEIADVRVAQRRLTTHNLEVANAHTFFVGEDAVLVHNAISKKTRETVRQKSRDKNGGVLKCNVYGIECVLGKRHKRGEVPPSNEAQMGH